MITPTEAREMTDYQLVKRLREVSRIRDYDEAYDDALVIGKEIHGRGGFPQLLHSP